MPPAAADGERPGPGAVVRADSGHFQLFRVHVATRRAAARRLAVRLRDRAGSAASKLAGTARSAPAGPKRSKAAGSRRERAARLRRASVARMRRAGMASPKRAVAAARMVARASAMEAWTVTRAATARAWRDRVLGLAAEAGFWALLSLAPLLLVLVAAIGYLAPLFGSHITFLVQEKIEHAAAHILAPTAVDHLLNPVLTDVVQHGRGGIISVSSLLALWTGSTAINTYVNTITIAYGMREVRSAVRARLLAFVIYLGGLLVGIVLLPLLITAPGWIIDVSPSGVAGIVKPAVAFGYWPTVVALCTLLLVVLYHFAVPVRGPWRRDLPGAVIAMLLWLASSFVLRSYLAFAIGHSPTYGALSAPIAALLFLYVTSLAVLVGAEINAEIDRDRIRRDKRAAMRAEGADGRADAAAKRLLSQAALLRAPDGGGGFADQLDRVIADDERDDEGDGRVEPVPAADGEDDGAAGREPGGGGGVRCGVEQDRLDVEILPGVAVAGVTGQDDGAGHHHAGRDGAGDQHRQAIDPPGSGGEPAGRRDGDREIDDQQPARVDERGDAGRVRVPRWAGAARWLPGEPDRQQGDPDGAGVGEVIGPGRQDGEGVRRHAGDHQRRDQCQVEEQDGGEPLGACHRGSLSDR